MALLIKLIEKRIGLTVLSIGLSILSIILSLWWNMQLSMIINMINAGTPVSEKTVVTAAITMLFIAGTAYILAICSGWTYETLIHDLRMAYARHFGSLTLTEIEELNAGEQLSKLQNEVVEVSGFLRSNLFSFVDDLIKFIATLSWMIYLNPGLSLIANGPSAIILWYTIYSSKIIGEAALQSQQANTEMNGFADTMITTFPILRLFNAASLIRNQYTNKLSQWESAGIIEERKRAKLMSLSALLSCIPLLLLFLYGGIQVIHGVTTIGTLYIFINLSGNVSGVLMNMPGRIAVFRRFSVNMKRTEPFVSIEAGRQ